MADGANRPDSIPPAAPSASQARDGTPPGGSPVRGRVQEPQETQTLVREGNYVGAQRVVDDLSDRGFPVEHLAIVGHGLRSVEDVTGRLTKGRAALQGAGGGAWFGLLVGLLIGLFAPVAAWLAVIVWSMLLGAIFGAVFGFGAHWSTRGARDFTSVQSLAADEYHVVVANDHADEARRSLGLEQPGAASPSGSDHRPTTTPGEPGRPPRTR